MNTDYILYLSLYKKKIYRIYLQQMRTCTALVILSYSTTVIKLKGKINGLLTRLCFFILFWVVNVSWCFINEQARASVSQEFLPWGQAAFSPSSKSTGALPFPPESLAPIPVFQTWLHRSFPSEAESFTFPNYLVQPAVTQTVTKSGYPVNRGGIDHSSLCLVSKCNGIS